MKAFFSLALWACAFCTLALHAELVILGGGDVMKVQSYLLGERTIHLELDSGGRITLPLSRVERILDDEIVPESEALPEHRGFEIGFDEIHPIPQAPFGNLIHNVARSQNLNPRLVTAMVRWESGFDPEAVSPRGARGLLQLMPATAERFGLDPLQISDPSHNLEAGARYIRWLADHFDNDLPSVLAAYNSGEGTVQRYQGVPPYRETREYLRRIYGELGIEGDV